MIFKIVRKSMFKKKGLIISIFILVILSSMFMGISSFTYDTLENSYKQMSKDGNVEDFRLLKNEQLKDYYTPKYEKEYEKHFDVNIEEKDYTIYDSRENGSTQVGITKFQTNAKFDKIILEDGKLPKNEGEVILQPEVLESFNKEIGDTLKINDTNYKISGTAYFQDFVYPTDVINSANFIVNLDEFYPVYMNETSYDKLDLDSADYTDYSYYAGKFNDSSLTTKDKTKLTTEKLNNEEELGIEIPKLNQLGQIEIGEDNKPETMLVPPFLFAYPEEFNISINAVNQEVDGAKSTFVFLSNLLSLMTIALTVVLVNSVFKSQRREMGILKAEGVSRNKLTFGFATFIALLVLVASFVGSLLSRYAMTPLLLNIYHEQFYIKYYDIQTSTIFLVILQVLILTAVITIITTIISVRRNLKTKTLLLIKNIDTERQPKHNFTKVFSRLSFARRYQINLLFRNFTKSILLAFGVFVSSFLILLGLLMFDGVNQIKNGTVGEVFKYNYEVQFNPQSDFEYKSDESIVTISSDIQKVSSDYKFEEDAKDSLTIEAYDMKDNDLIAITDSKTGDLVKPSDGLVITKALATKYDLEVGDTITIDNFTDDSEKPKTIKFKVNQITDSYFAPYAFMDINEFHKKYDLPDEFQNGYVSADKLTNETHDEILEKDPLATITESVDLQSQIESSIQLFYAIIVIIALFAAFIAFISLSAISSVIIDSNRKTISVMKVLGYTSKEVRIMTVGFYRWFVIFIYLISIPILLTLINLVIKKAFSDSDFTIPTNYNIPLLLSGLIIIFLTYLISASLAQRKVNKIKLAESLKADE